MAAAKLEIVKAVLPNVLRAMARMAFDDMVYVMTETCGRFKAYSR